jgi:hypothetical protein
MHARLLVSTFSASLESLALHNSVTEFPPMSQQTTCSTGSVFLAKRIELFQVAEFVSPGYNESEMRAYRDGQRGE